MWAGAAGAAAYADPLATPGAVAGSFGEYRGARLHGGVDFSTNGRTGIAVRAAADGYVSRMAITSGGFGRALYVRHADGRTTVYAHLEKFDEKSLGLEGLAKREREKRGRYAVESEFAPDRFPVRRGQVIAYSGDTGGVAPHLHFEVRDAGGTRMDPLRNGLRPPRGRPPVLAALAVERWERAAEAERGEAGKIRVYRLMRARDVGTSRTYAVAGGVLRLRGVAALYLLAWTPAQDPENRLGLRALDCVLDGRRIVSWSHDRLDLGGLGLGDFVFDPSLSGGKPLATWHRLTPAEGVDALVAAERLPMAGVAVRVGARGAFGGSSQVSFRLASERGGERPVPEEPSDRASVAEPDRVLRDEWELADGSEVRLRLDEGTVAAPKRVAVVAAEIPSAARRVLAVAGAEIVASASAFQIEPSRAALRRSFELRADVPRAVTSTAHVGLARYQPRRAVQADGSATDGGEWEWLAPVGDGADRLDAQARRFGLFAWVRDERPPRILRTDPPDGARLRAAPERVLAWIEDAFPGVDGVATEVRLDDTALPYDWNASRGRLVGEIEAALASGPHRLQVAAVDRAGNRADPVFVAFSVETPHTAPDAAASRAKPGRRPTRRPPSGR